jgi:O-antigen/teichoic acid export membrane protein
VSATATTTVRSAVTTSALGKAAEMVTLVLLATVVPRVLGPAAYGRFAVPLTIVTLGSLALTLGGPTLMARFVPAAPPEDRVALARSLGTRLARGRALQLAVIAAGVLVLVLVAPEDFPPVVSTLVLAALAVNVGTSIALQVTLGLGQAGPWSVRWPLQNAVLVVAVLALHPLDGSTAEVAAILLSGLSGAVLATVAVTPVLRLPAEPMPVPPGAIRFGVLQAAGAALVQFAQRGGVVAVALLGGTDTEAGYAALAIGIALGATYAILQAFTVALPHLSDASVDIEASEVRYRRMAAILLAVVLPGALLGVLALDAVVPIVFGDRFDGAADAFGPALAVVVLAPLSALLVQVSALRLRAGASLTGGIAAASAFVVVAVVAVPAWAAVGATTATLAGAVAGAVATLAVLPRAAGRLPLTSFVGAAAVVTLSAVV